MGWLQNLFSPASTTTRKGQALSNTHDAFALPTHSPGFGGSVRTTDPYSPHIADGDPNTAYTYPPPSSNRPSFDYVPSPTSARGRQTSLLPLHNGFGATHSSSGPQPPLEHTWARLRNWLGREYPELGDTLNYGIPPLELSTLEMQLGGLELPAAVRDSYLCVDGQEPESSAACTFGLFFGLTLLPFEDVVEEWRFWREVDEDPSTGANPRLRMLMGSIPPGYIRREYSSRGWIPLAADKAGNYLGVDLNPDEKGSAGQVIIFGRDIDTKVVLWRGDGPDGWAKWLASFAEELESGDGFEFGGGNQNGSDEDEDDIGYGGYYYDGAGNGQGASGGDSGAGGLRLAGEYRGWEVLQAWADRSIRRWQASGAYPDTSELSGGASKLQEKIGLGVVEFPDEQSSPSSASSSGAKAPEPPALSFTPSSPAVASASKHMTRMSISRAPAPMPVALPTEQDILVEGDGDEYSDVPDDIEATGVYPMENADGGSSIQTVRSPAVTADAPIISPVLTQEPASQEHPLADLLGDAPVQQPEPPLIPSIAISNPDTIAEEPANTIVGEHSEEEEDDDEEESEDEDEAPVAPAAPVATTPAVTAPLSEGTSASTSSPSSPTSSDIEGFETVDAPAVDEMGRKVVAS